MIDGWSQYDNCTVLKIESDVLLVFLMSGPSYNINM